MDTHLHIIDLSPESSTPSTPATRASSTASDAFNASSYVSDDSLLSPLAIPSAPLFIAATSPSLRPRLPRQHDAAVHAAEAAARRIAALLIEAETANASAEVRFIGQQADQALEALGDARLATEQALAGGQGAAVQDNHTNTRDISLQNAIVHDLHKQARNRGETILLKELPTAADEVAHLPRSKEEVARLKAQLQEKRELARVGLHANNRSAGTDSRAIANRIQDEIMNLHMRTGTRCVALFTQSGGSFDFFIQSLKIAGLDLLHLFEHSQRDSVVRLKSEITQTLNSGLYCMTKNQKLKMSYTNFNTDIKLAWKVKLVGWPDDIPFVKPSDLGSSDRVRSSQIHWVYLELDEIAELEADIERRRAAGTLHKARKPRYNINLVPRLLYKSTRRHRDDDEDGDEDDEGDASDSDHDDANESDEDDAPRPTSSTRRAALAPQMSSRRAPEAPPVQYSSRQAAPPTTAPAASTPLNLSSGMPDIDFDVLFPLAFENLDYSNIPTADFDSLMSGFGSGCAAWNDLFAVPNGISTSDAALSGANITALAPNTSIGARVLSSTSSSATTTIRFRAPATPNTLPGQKRKNSAGDRDAAPAAKKQRKAAGSGEAAAPPPLLRHTTLFRSSNENRKNALKI
ncbi:hypothetical protein MVEN_00056500 [Mycena venus]|uniref:Uncharacterized protein n=1 Tax=Mycena venus TaxID=2733690 RepID=A0A8H6Z3M3_9AGAR|nr:hypothetical protein MVEN_00056500 [Mycena venus]